MRRLPLIPAAFLAATAVIGTAPTASASQLNYVAMGDSYSAGSGILPLSSYTPICTQTSKNAAHDIAAAKGYALTDVTCGGAQTKDFAGNQFGIVAPQYNALSANTNLVTLTIGGNDGNVFVNNVLTCGSLGILTLGIGKPCTNHFGTSQFDLINNQTYPAIVKTLQGIKARAPHARIAIAGYPQLLPQDGSSCYLSMPIAKGDVPYLNTLEKTLNSAVSRAAAATGATYVDMWAPSQGHDSCKSSSVRWVEPALWGSNFVPVHPNAAGEAAYANRYIATLGL
ncbi:SGNH/GDSL hydrolase family protein [Calidifontibacter terrae]